MRFLTILLCLGIMHPAYAADGQQPDEKKITFDAPVPASEPKDEGDIVVASVVAAQKAEWRRSPEENWREQEDNIGSWYRFHNKKPERPGFIEPLGAKSDGKVIRMGTRRPGDKK